MSTIVAAAKPLRAVVVDDTPDLRALLIMTLESSGDIAVVAEAGNGLDGVQLVKQHSPDLILLDLAMPVMDGLEALPLMRRSVPQATIIVLSGFGAGTMAGRVLTAGADGYLQKGASPATILEYVRGLVGNAPTGLRVVHGKARPPRTRPTLIDPELPSYDEQAALSMWFSPVATVVTTDTPDLLITGANPAAVAMIHDPQLEGRSLTEVMPDVAGLVHGLHAEADEHEVTLGHPAQPLVAKLRRAQGLVLIYLQPRETSGAAEALRRAIATTAHEIRNPVTVLLGIVDTVRDHGDELSVEQRQRLREAAHRQAKLLDSITADLLIAAQARRGTVTVDLELLDVGSAIRSIVCDQFDDVAVEVAHQAEAWVDAFRLEQMVTNLITNARKYGAPPYVVRVRREESWVVIEAVDSGEGVPPEFRDKLFEEFTRAGGGSARGTGLGLFVVRSLVEAHRGKVTYHDAAAGGAVFSLWLPAGD